MKFSDFMQRPSGIVRSYLGVISGSKRNYGLKELRDIGITRHSDVKTANPVYLIDTDHDSDFYNSDYVADCIKPGPGNNGHKFEVPLYVRDSVEMIIGDVFAATTHVDFMLRAKGKKVDIEVINNASVLTAIGEVGLELYKYGKVTSIPFENENVDTPVNVLKDNQSLGLHTLFLLDLDPKNDNFLSFGSAAKYLISKGVGEDVVAIGCAALGTKNKEIKVLKLKDMIEINKYPQCLIIPGKLHFVEEEALELWK